MRATGLTIERAARVSAALACLAAVALVSAGSAFGQVPRVDRRPGFVHAPVAGPRPPRPRPGPAVLPPSGQTTPTGQPTSRSQPPAPPPRRVRVTDRGVVQGIDDSAVVLTALDGSAITLALGPGTRIYVNGRPASAEDVPSGLAATVTHVGDEPALEVRATGQPPQGAGGPETSGRAPGQRPPATGFTSRLTDQGIVQSVSASAVVLRALDGTAVTIAVDSGTLVSLNGRPASISGLGPGLVATVVHPEGGTALEIRATGQPPPPPRRVRVTDQGAVQDIGGDEIVLRGRDGSTITLALGPDTRVYVNGRPASAGDVGPGFSATVTHVGDDPALELRATGRKPR